MDVRISHVLTAGLVSLAALLAPAPAVGEEPAAAQPEAPPGALFGAHVQAAGDEIARQAAFEQRERDLGRRLGIDHRFYAWEDTFPTAREQWDLEQGRVPMISWQGSLTLGIELGLEDELIKARAEAVRELPGRVFIRWMWEMDNDAKESAAVHPDRFVAAWRHIHDIFTSRGATNVAWVWCPGAESFTTGEAELFYPGADYVDWTCADGYNRIAGPDDPWRWFDDIFGAFYHWGLRQGKPMMVGEFGIDERNAGEKAVWLRDAFELVRTYLPGIRALVYFDGRTDRDWTMGSTADSLAAFRESVADPYYRIDPELLLNR